MNITNILNIPTRRSDPCFEYNYFSILKFIFVLCIAVIHHNLFNPTLVNTSWLFRFIYVNGHELIYLFFIMSGILFFKLTIPKINSKELSFPNFIKHKLNRFFVLVFVTSITMYIMNYVYFNKFGKDFLECSRDPITLVISIIFGGSEAIFGLGNPNNTPLWFLNILLFMYTIGFLITKLGKKYNFIYIFLAALGAGMLYSELNYPFFNVFVGKGLLGFSLGVLFANLLDKTKALNNKKQLIIRLLWLLPLISIIILIGLKDINSIRGNTLIFTFLLFIPLIGILYNIKSLNNICSHKICLVLERLSIGVYFWNYPIILMFYLGFNNTIPKFASSGWFILILLVVNIAFAFLSIYFYKILSFVKKSLIQTKFKLN